MTSKMSENNSTSKKGIYLAHLFHENNDNEWARCVMLLCATNLNRIMLEVFCIRLFLFKFIPEYIFLLCLERFFKERYTNILAFDILEEEHPLEWFICRLQRRKS